MTREQMMNRLRGKKSLVACIEIVRHYLDTSILTAEERKYFEELIRVSIEQDAKLKNEPKEGTK